jgi:hypothetical protein
MSNFTLPSLPVTFFAIGGSQTSKQFNGKKPGMRGLLVSCFPLVLPLSLNTRVSIVPGRRRPASIFLQSSY